MEEEEEAEAAAAAGEAAAEAPAAIAGWICGQQRMRTGPERQREPPAPIPPLPSSVRSLSLACPCCAACVRLTVVPCVFPCWSSSLCSASPCASLCCSSSCPRCLLPALPEPPALAPLRFLPPAMRVAGVIVVDGGVWCCRCLDRVRSKGRARRRGGRRAAGGDATGTRTTESM